MKTMNIAITLLAALLLSGSMTASAGTLSPANATALPDDSSAIQDWQARLEMAKLLAYTKRYDESATQYRKVLAERPKYLPALIGLAQTLVWAGRASEAGSLLQDIPVNELDEELCRVLADQYISRKEYDRVVELTSSFLRTHPGAGTVRLRLADAYSYSGRYPESLQEYETLVAAYPGDIQLRRKYARVLSWAGRHDDAIRQMKQTLRD